MSEQPKKPTELKKENSYTYWVDANNRSRELPEQHRPKKIQPPLVQVTTNTNGPSKWNALGSWQQRAVPLKELGENVQKQLQSWINQRKIQLLVREVKLEGEFKQIFSNNKRKILYEITGKVKFQGEDLQLKLEELSCSGDRQYRTKGKKGQQRAILDSVAGQLIDVIVGVFNLYKS